MWKFLNTGRSPGAFNMSYDEQLARELFASEHEGVVRVYGWKPPCISIGFHQSFEGVNLDKCRMEAIDVVRRPTGGRAVLHWEEATYSVVAKANGESISEVHRSIGLALERGLKLLNSEIALAQPEPSGQRSERPYSNIPCYVSIARYEIQYRGKKIVGSAQRRYSFGPKVGPSNSQGNCEIILQHGSILLGPAHRRLAEFLSLEDEQAIRAVEREFEMKSIELSSILGRRVEFEEVTECLQHGFEAEWGIRFQNDFHEVPILHGTLSASLAY